MLNIREVLNGVKKYVDEVVNEAVSGSKCNGGGGSINYKKLERTNEEIKKDESLEIDLKEILNEELDDENNTIFINYYCHTFCSRCRTTYKSKYSSSRTT